MEPNRAEPTSILMSKVDYLPYNPKILSLELETLLGGCMLMNFRSELPLVDEMAEKRDPNFRELPLKISCMKFK